MERFNKQKGIGEVNKSEKDNKRLTKLEISRKNHTRFTGQRFWDSLRCCSVSCNDTSDQKGKNIENNIIDKSDKNNAFQTLFWEFGEVILERAKPVLPDQVRELLVGVKNYHQKEHGSKQLSGDEVGWYINTFKEAAKLWSSASWQKFEDRGAEFIVTDQWNYAKSQYIKSQSYWQFCLPEKTKKPKYVKDMFLRFNDESLTLEHNEFFEHDKLIANKRSFNADLEGRSNVTARSLEMNLELGDQERWPFEDEDYPLAKQHYEDYQTGIKEAIDNGKITIDTSADKVRKIGYEFARKKIIERNTPKDDIPAIFLNVLPGSYFEELDRFKQMDRKVKLKESIEINKYRRDQINKDRIIEIIDNETIRVNKSMKVGTEECNILVKFLEAREKQTGKKSTLKAVVLPNKEIWVLPYRLEGNEKTKHSIVASGEPCVWAGEVDLDFKARKPKIRELKGDSGHYKTYDSDPTKQKEIFQFAALAFSEAGYDTCGLPDVSKMGIRHAENQSMDGDAASMAIP